MTSTYLKDWMSGHNTTGCSLQAARRTTLTKVSRRIAGTISFKYLDVYLSVIAALVTLGTFGNSLELVALYSSHDFWGPVFPRLLHCHLLVWAVLGTFVVHY